MKTKARFLVRTILLLLLLQSFRFYKREREGCGSYLQTLQLSSTDPVSSSFFPSFSPSPASFFLGFHATAHISSSCASSFLFNVVKRIVVIVIVFAAAASPPALLLSLLSLLSSLFSLLSSLSLFSFGVDVTSTNRFDVQNVRSIRE